MEIALLSQSPPHPNYHYHQHTHPTPPPHTHTHTHTHRLRYVQLCENIELTAFANRVLKLLLIRYNYISHTNPNFQHRKELKEKELGLESSLAFRVLSTQCVQKVILVETKGNTYSKMILHSMHTLTPTKLRPVNTNTKSSQVYLAQSVCRLLLFCLFFFLLSLSLCLSLSLFCNIYRSRMNVFCYGNQTGLLL